MLRLLIILVFGIHFLFGNYAFYSKVRNTCSSYRLVVEQKDMRLTDEGFTLTMNSKRNNFERVMLIGFASVGKAMEHQRHLEGIGKIEQALIPASVTIIVNVPVTRDNLIVSASASTELIEKLSAGIIETSQFMQEIKDSIQTL